MSTVLCAYLCGLSAQSLAMSVPTRRLTEDMILMVIVGIFFEDTYSLSGTKGRLKSLECSFRKPLMQ